MSAAAVVRYRCPLSLSVIVVRICFPLPLSERRFSWLCPLVSSDNPACKMCPAALPADLVCNSSAETTRQSCTIASSAIDVGWVVGRRCPLNLSFPPSTGTVGLSRLSFVFRLPCQLAHPLMLSFSVVSWCCPFVLSVGVVQCYRQTASSAGVVHWYCPLVLSASVAPRCCPPVLSDYVVR